MANEFEYARTREYLKGKMPSYLRSKGFNINQNFKCFNPSHRDHGRSMQYDKTSHTVFCEVCNAQYDIFDLIGIEYGLDLEEQRFRKVHEMYIGPLPQEFMPPPEPKIAVAPKKEALPLANARFVGQGVLAPYRHRHLYQDNHPNIVNASAASQRDGQRLFALAASGEDLQSVDVNARRDYSTSFGQSSSHSYQPKAVSKLISINQSGDVTSIRSPSNMNKPQSSSSPKQSNKQNLSLAGGIKVFSVSKEEAAKISSSKGSMRLDQLSPDLAAEIRSSNPIKVIRSTPMPTEAQSNEPYLAQDRAEPRLNSVQNLNPAQDSAQDLMAMPFPTMGKPKYNIAEPKKTEPVQQAPQSSAHSTLQHSSRVAKAMTEPTLNQTAFNQAIQTPSTSNQPSAGLSPFTANFTAYSADRIEPELKNVAQPTPFSSQAVQAQQPNSQASQASAKRIFSPLPPNIGQGKPLYLQQETPNFFASSQQNTQERAQPKVNKAFTNPVFTAPVISTPQAIGKEATRAPLHPIDEPTLSAQVDKAYEEVWGDHNKSRQQKQEATALAAEKERRRLREAEFSRQIQQQQYEHQRQEANLATVAAIIEAEDTPYLAPNQNISDYEQAKAQRQAEAQAINEAQMVTGNVARYLPPSIQSRVADPNIQKILAREEPTPGISTYTTHGSGLADTSINESRPVHSIVTGLPQNTQQPHSVPSQSEEPRSSLAGTYASRITSSSVVSKRASTSEDTASNVSGNHVPEDTTGMSAIAGMMNKISGTSNGSSSNGHSYHKEEDPSKVGPDPSHTWQQVFGDAELPLLNPTAPSTLINGRSYNFEQMDEHSLRHSIEKNLASDTARISANTNPADTSQDQYALYESAKNRASEIVATHIYGRAAKNVSSTEDTLPKVQTSASDPYNAAKRSNTDATRSTFASADTAITGIQVNMGAPATKSRDDKTATVVQRTPSGAVVGATSEVHSTPSVAERIQQELAKKQRSNEQNTRISGVISKVEPQRKPDEINTYISKSNSNAPLPPEVLPPLHTGNPYSTTIFSGEMKDRYIQKPSGSGNVASNTQIHRGPRIDFSGKGLGQDSTVTTSTNHIAQIDLTNLDSINVGTKESKSAEQTSTPLNFFARAQDADGLLRNTIVVEDMDDFEQKSNELAQKQRARPTDSGEIIPVDTTAQRNRLESILSILETEPTSSVQDSKLSAEKLRELESLATLPSIQEKKAELEALGHKKHYSGSANGKHDSAAYLKEALDNSTAVFTAAAAIKATSLSFDKDLVDLGLESLATHESKDARLEHESLERHAINQLKQSIDSADSVLDGRSKSIFEHQNWDSSGKPNKKSELNIEVLQAKDVLKDPSLLPPNARFVSGNKERPIAADNREETIEILHELVQGSDMSKTQESETPVPNAQKSNLNVPQDSVYQPQVSEHTTQSNTSDMQGSESTQAQSHAPYAYGTQGSEPPTITTPVSNTQIHQTPAMAQAAVSGSQLSSYLGMPPSFMQPNPMMGMMPPAMPMGTVMPMMPQPMPGMVGMPPMMQMPPQMMGVAPLSDGSMPQMAQGIMPAQMPNVLGSEQAQVAQAMPSVEPEAQAASTIVEHGATEDSSERATQDEVRVQTESESKTTSENATSQVLADQENRKSSADDESSEGLVSSNTSEDNTDPDETEAVQEIETSSTEELLAGRIDKSSEGRQLSHKFWVESHGLSPEIVERYDLKYVQQLPVVTQTWNAGVIPINDSCKQVVNAQSGETFLMGEDVPCFNLESLTQSKEGLNNALFIVSSALDALSLESLGISAAALMRPENADRLLEYLQDNMQSTMPFYVSLDKGEKWLNAGKRLEWGFEQMQYPHKLIDLAGSFGSINQALKQDRRNLLNKLQNPEALNSLVILPDTTAPESQEVAGATANQLNQIQLLEVFAPMKDSGFILSIESLAKLELANVLYTMTSTNVAISRLILSSIMLNQEPVLFAGSKMQWQMLCNRIATLPAGGVLSSNAATAVGNQEANPNELSPGVAPQPCNARLIELPLEFDTKSLLITVTQAVMTARNTLPNFANLRLMLDTYSFEPRFCAALSPLLAELALNLNLPIMVWCSNEQRNFFEGQSVQTIEISKNLENEILFKTFDQNCHLQSFRTKPY